MKRFLSPRVLVVIAAVALSGLVPLLVWLGFLRLEVPGQHWFYHNFQPPRPFLLVPLVALVLLLLALGRALTGQTREWIRPVLLLAVVASCLLSLGVRGSARMGFVNLAMSIIYTGSNSYYQTAMQTPDVLALARDYPRQMPRLPLHATTQSPGVVLLHAGLRHLFISSPAAMSLAEKLLWINPCIRPGEVAREVNPVFRLTLQPSDVSGALLLALLFPLVMALGVLPCYGLTRRLAGVRPALLVAALYAVTPAFVWYSASVDQLYITLALVVAWLGLAGVQESRRWLLALAGSLAGLTTFLNLGFALLVGITTLFVFLLAWGRQASRLRAALGAAVLVLGGAVLSLMGVCLACGVNLPAIVAVIARLRTELYHDLGRGYLTWLLLNPVEFALGLGFSGAALVVAGVVLWRRLTYPAGVLLTSVLVGLVGLALLGQVRGETSRMLMFVMPLLLAGVAPVVRWLRLHHGVPAVALVAAQAAYAVVCYHLFDVWGDWTQPFR